LELPSSRYEFPKILTNHLQTGPDGTIHLSHELRN
jgi:hypothetical protein